MIKGILIVNNHGKPRVVKFYEHVVRLHRIMSCTLRPLAVLMVDGKSRHRLLSDVSFALGWSMCCFAQPDAEQQAVIRDIYTQVSKRPDTLCNFLEGTVRYWGDGVKLIYRHYATLYFVFAVDQQESDLGILDLIQGTNGLRQRGMFVETLDKIFENVCELDLIFHSDKVHYALDEIVMGGMVLETNINEVLTAVNEMNRMDSVSSRRSLQVAMKK
ncbi:hypothetical protein BBJ28_00010718 [Nothophytophthora sp. Chile5]|nr:hypothetical protein BBJ28_00010718 [Nothophytophthora sp. Chile5]